MQNFTIEKKFKQENGPDIVEVSHYNVSLDGGVAKICSLDDNDENPVLITVQPWQPLGDGSRSEWNNEQEVMDWFRSVS